MRWWPGLRPSAGERYSRLPSWTKGKERESERGWERDRGGVKDGKDEQDFRCPGTIRSEVLPPNGGT